MQRRSRLLGALILLGTSTASCAPADGPSHEGTVIGSDPLLASCAVTPKTGSAPPEVSFHVPDTGDDRAAIQSAIQSAIAAKVPAEVVLGARTYRLVCQDAPETFCLSMKGARNVTLRGEPGATLLVATPRAGGIQLEDSVGVTFANFTLDYETPPFSQGTITAVTSNSFVVRIDPGYPSPASPLLRDDIFIGSTNVAIGFVYDSSGHLKHAKREFVGLTGIPTLLPDGAWSFGANTTRNGMAVGDRFAYGPRRSNALALLRSANLAIDSVNIFTSPSLAILAIANKGQIAMKNLSVIPTPGSNRLMSAVSDAIHMQENTAEVSITDSTFGAMGDDALNTYAVGAVVGPKAGLAPNQLRVSQTSLPMATGERIQVVDTAVHPRFASDGEPAIVDIAADGSWVRLTLDQSASVVNEGDVVFDTAHSVPKLTFVRNRLKSFRGRMRIRSPRATVASNVFEDARNARILIAGDVSPLWREGPSVNAPWTFANEIPSGALTFLGVGDTVLGTAQATLLPAGSVDRAPTFVASYYRATYPDLASLSDAKLLNHWKAYGVSEGRVASRTFSPAEYLALYPDLRAAFGSNGYTKALEHYEAYGRNERRAGRFALESHVFVPSAYRMLNPDLANLTDSEAREHWLAHGLAEGRSASIDFSPREYLLTHPDLEAAFGVDKEAAIAHYVQHGINEGRAGRFAFAPGVFDPCSYLQRNPDLFFADATYAQIHWVTAGIAEGRSASKTFDLAGYRAKNPDLMAIVAARGYPGLLEHWVHNGKSEGRVWQ